MTKEITTFDQMAEALVNIMQSIERLEAKVDALAPQKEEQRTLDIDAASVLIGKAKATIYTMARTGRIPAYKQGKKLYFLENELRAWMTRSPTSSTVIASTVAKEQTTAQDYIANIHSTRRRRSVSIV